VYAELSQKYAQLLVLWMDMVRKGAWLISLAAILGTVAAFFYLTENIAINTSTTDMLSPELAFRKQAKALDAAFPQFSNNILVVLDGKTPDGVDDGADILAARLRARPELFGDVYDLAGHSFFRRNGLLYLDLEELYDLSDRLAEAQPFLGGLWRDPTMRGLFSMLELAIDETLREGGARVPIEVAGVLGAMAETLDAQANNEFSQLSWQELMQGGDGEDSKNQRFLLIQPVLDFSSLQPAGKAMEAIREIAREAGIDEAHGLRLRLSGSAALEQEELGSVEKGMGLAGILSLIFVVGLLISGLRSKRLVAATLATLIIGLVWTAAFAIFALGQLNLISVAFAVLFIGLSVDFGIHFALRYKEEIDGGGDHAHSLREAGSGVGGAMTLCALSAAIAFYSFLPTDYLGLAELGLIAGTGMFIALFANMTVLPAFLTLHPLRAANRVPAGRFRLAYVQSVICDHAKTIVIAAIVLAGASLALIPFVRFDFDPMNLRDPQTESVSTLLEMSEDSQTSPYTISILANNLEEAASLAEKLSSLSEVDKALSLADYVPEDQEEKLEIIQTMALFLAPALAESEKMAALTDRERRELLAAFNGKLNALVASKKGGAAVAAERLLRSFAFLASGKASEQEIDERLKEAEKRLLSALPNRLKALSLSLQAELVGLEGLPDALRQRQVASDGRAKIEVFPKEDLRDRDALQRFVSAVRKIAPGATGAPVVILEAGETVVEAFREAAVLAIVLITLLLAVLMHRVRDIFLIFAPLTLAALLTVDASVLIGVPFNFANVIVLPLLFGLGVASGIHLVVREHLEHTTIGIIRTSTPSAVVYSALTTIASFATIALSSHPGTASMGILLSIAITMTLVCTLVVLPAAMVMWRTPEEEL
jgi:uncharacterized protein